MNHRCYQLTECTTYVKILLKATETTKVMHPLTGVHTSGHLNSYAIAYNRKKNDIA